MSIKVAGSLFSLSMVFAMAGMTLLILLHGPSARHFWTLPISILRAGLNGNIQDHGIVVAQNPNGEKSFPILDLFQEQPLEPQSTIILIELLLNTTMNLNWTLQ